MLTLFLILFIALLIFTTIRKRKIKNDFSKTNKKLYSIRKFGYTLLQILSILIIIVLFIILCIITTNVATENVITSKIEMYQKENTNIEDNLHTIIDEYMNHENSTITSIIPDSNYFNIITSLPKLKSDKIIQKELEVYISNNEKIKKLKEEKIEIARLKWYLYFGH